MCIDKQVLPQSLPQHHKVLEENTSTNSFVVVLCHFYEVAEGYKEVPRVNKQESRY
jgi:hypothetical protein